MKNCSSCQTLIRDQFAFCPQCGTHQLPTSDSPNSALLTQGTELDVESWTWDEAMGVIEDALNICHEIEREFRNGIVRVRKAVQSEVKWGGLIFNPQDIGKKLAELQAAYKRIFEDGQPLGVSTTTLRLTTWRISANLSDAQKLEIEEGYNELSAALDSVNQQVIAVGNWMTSFYSALCTTGTARALLPFLPGTAYEEEGLPTRYTVVSKGFFQRLFGTG